MVLYTYSVSHTAFDYKCDSCGFDTQLSDKIDSYFPIEEIPWELSARSTLFQILLVRRGSGAKACDCKRKGCKFDSHLKEWTYILTYLISRFIPSGVVRENKNNPNATVSLKNSPEIGGRS